MLSHIASQTLQFTPHIVTLVALLIGAVLGLYFLSARDSDMKKWSTGWSNDPEHMLLAGLLVIAIGVFVVFVVVTLGFTVFETN